MPARREIAYDHMSWPQLMRMLYREAYTLQAMDGPGVPYADRKFIETRIRDLAREVRTRGLQGRLLP